MKWIEKPQVNKDLDSEIFVSQEICTENFTKIDFDCSSYDDCSSKSWSC